MGAKKYHKARYEKTVPSNRKNHRSRREPLEKVLIKKVKKSDELTEHHRRPRSLGGTTDRANISIIPIYIHKAWHVIVGNMNPEQICNIINLNFKPKGLTLVCEFINGKRCTKQGENDSRSCDFEKISLAWKTLFEKATSFRQKIEYINNVLLDPAYHFYIRD